MKRKFDQLWMIGDSYSYTDNHVPLAKSFYGLAATYLGCHTIRNLSRIGNSWNSVQQLLVGNNDQIDWANDFVLIGIPPLERITVFDREDNSAYSSHIIDTQTWQYSIKEEPSHQGLISHHCFGQDKWLITHENRSWTEIQTLRDIFLITKWLDSVSAHYLLLNLSKSLSNDNQWPPSQAVIGHVNNHPRCLLFDNTYRDINIGHHLPDDTSDPNGHHGAAGNFRFWDLGVRPLIERIYLC